MKKIFLLLLAIVSIEAQPSPEIKKPNQEFTSTKSRARRPGKLKEDIASSLIAIIDFATDLIRRQAHFQIQLLTQKNAANAAKIDQLVLAQAKIIDQAAVVQNNSYCRLKELAEADKQAYLNGAATKELQASLQDIQGYVERMRSTIGQLAKHQLVTSKSYETIEKIGQEIVALLQEIHQFVHGGCKAKRTEQKK